jgi:hypothetical protein
MSLALATKGILPDFTGTGTGGTGQTIYVVEDINVEVSQDNLAIEVSLIDEISLDISEIGVIIDLDEDQAEIVVSEDDSINIEV